MTGLEKITTQIIDDAKANAQKAKAAAEEEADPPQAARDRVMAPARNNAISFFFIVFPP